MLHCRTLSQIDKGRSRNSPFLSVSHRRDREKEDLLAALSSMLAASKVNIDPLVQLPIR